MLLKPANELRRDERINVLAKTDNTCSKNKVVSHDSGAIQKIHVANDKGESMDCADTIVAIGNFINH